MTNPIQIGDKVYLGSFNTDVHVFGEISDLDTPDQVSFTMEGFGANALLNTRAIVGPPGPAGTSAPLGKRQFPIYDSEDDLPSNLTNDNADIGKYWIVRVFDDNDNEVGSNWYMWNGYAFERFKMGMPGQAGPVPNVTWTFQVVSDDSITTSVKTTETGDPYNPSVLVQIYDELIRGPQGIAAPWGLYGAGGESEGEIPVWDAGAGLYLPKVPVNPVPKFWTYPEASFTSVPLAIGTEVPIGTALIPPIPWDTKPWCSGVFRLAGVELDSTPFSLGVQVRLGNPTSGTIVARGFGRSGGYVELHPHSSTGDSPADAITPDNNRALIPANATGSAATLYVNAFNDGVAGVYHFNNEGAQLGVMAVPV